MKAKTLLALCAAGMAANAATVNLLRNSNNGFTDGTDWNDNGNPPVSGKNYLVADGYFLRGDYSQAFAGDSLQFGVVGGTEGIFFKEHSGTHTFTKLILANGYYRTWMSESGQNAHIAGTVEVTSPESAPFRLYGTHTSGSALFVTYWDAAFTGAVGTGLVLGPYPGVVNSTPEIVFTGDNSAYLGSLSVTGAKTILGFTTGSSLGGALASLKSDALSLSDNAMLDSRGADVTLASSLNRGITVAASGARLMVSRGKSLRLEWPVSGSGTLMKTAAGTLTLASSFNVPLNVSYGAVVFADGFSGSSGVSVSSANAEISVAAGAEIQIPNLTIAAGSALRIAYDETSGESGVLVLGSGSNLSWPIAVYPHSVRGVKVPFLKVPTSLRTVTAADFAKPDDLASTGLPSATFTVETEGGVQTVYAETATQVTIVTTNPSDGKSNNKAYLYPYSSDKWMWSDNKVVHAGADYLVSNGQYIHSTGLSGAWTLPGDSLTFVGASTSSRSYWELGNLSLTAFTGDIRTGNFVQVKPTAADGGELHLCGRLYVGNNRTSDEGLDFRAQKSGIDIFIDSVVSGSGQMAFQPIAAGQTNTYCFTSANTFAGTYFVYGSKTDSMTTLKFASASAWGANPASLKEQGVILQSNATLYPAGSQTVNHPNRCVRFYGAGQKLRVDEGETFELRNPVSFVNGTTLQANIAKTGGGTWAVGGSVSVNKNGRSEAPLLKISEGFIRLDYSPRSFAAMEVVIEDGAGIAAKYRPGETSNVATYGMMVTNAANFSVNGDTLKFKIFTGGERVGASEKVAILTVPAATAAAIDAKAIRFEHDDAYGRHPVLEREAVTVSGQQSVRYSCRFIRGTTFILR